MDRIYLSRRNLRTLLSKLDRLEAGEQTTCEVIKFQHPKNPPELMQTMVACSVVAVPDEVFYAQRPTLAMMHPLDDPLLTPEQKIAMNNLFFGDEVVRS